jgi:predicted MPP superfamily phosphohydrolase
MKRRIQTGIGALGALAAAVGWYAWRIETRWLHVNHLTFSLPGLPPAFDGYRIAHISDLHLSARIIRDHLPNIVAAVNRERPDLIAITGDYVTHHRDNFWEMCPVLAQLRAPDGVWSVLGNHDLCAGAESVIDVLNAAGIRTLRNQHHLLQRCGEQLVLAGIDDVVWGQPDLAATLDGLSAHSRAVLLAHEPDFARDAAIDPRIVLQLSGHGHGGQIRVPGINKPLFLPSFATQYPVGEYQVGGMTLYVTRGLGVSLLHMRFNCRPEIAIITLTRSRLRRVNGATPHA